MVIRDLNQGSSAPSSVANIQCTVSAMQPISIQKTSNKNHKKYKVITRYWKKKHKKTQTKENNNNSNTQPHKPQQHTEASTTTTQPQQNTNTNHNIHTITTISRAKTKKKKGRAQNKTNSKKRTKNTLAPEGLPSGDPGQPRGFAFCGDQSTQAVSRKRQRNTKRGLRSKQKIEERKIKRNYKKREARRKHRAERQANKPQRNQNANSASAQEPLKKLKIELGKEIHIATLNIRGTNKLGKREEVEDWMKNHNISILALQ